MKVQEFTSISRDEAAKRIVLILCQQGFSAHRWVRNEGQLVQVHVGNGNEEATYIEVLRGGPSYGHIAAHSHCISIMNLTENALLGCSIDY
jgi:hypothetical protein